jgi:uncharacterized protein YbcV (DUF1398 family)
MHILDGFTRPAPRHAMPGWVAVLCAAALLTPVARATDYHLAADGDDTADGLASAPAGGSGPWRTLPRLQGVPLKGGDRVLLRCGQRFQGPVVLLLRGGGDAGPVVLASDGKCAAGQLPLVDGKPPLLAAPGADGVAVWQAPAAVSQVFFDNAVLLPARFPVAQYLIYPPGQAPDTQHLPPHAQLAGKDLKGARVFARTEEWFLEDRVLRSAQGDLSAAFDYPVRAGSGVYLVGKDWMLGTRPGWAYDASTGRLHLRNPDQRAVAVSLDQALLRIEGKGSLSVSDIRLDGAGGNGLDLHVDGDVRVERVTVARSAGNAMAIAGARHATVVASLVDGAGRDGIFFAEVDKVDVRGNRVLGAGTYLGPRPSLAAINAHRTNAATVDENLVRDSGYIGIRVSGDARVRRNLVDGSCLNLSDCAAIYTWRRNAQDVRPASVISGNLILRVAGDTTVKLGVIDYFSGIYLDEFTRFVTVRDNVIAGVEQGIYLHNAVLNVVSDNHVIGAKGKPMLVGVDARHFKGDEPVANDLARNQQFGADVAWRAARQDAAPAGAVRWAVELTRPGAAALSAPPCRALNPVAAASAASALDVPLGLLMDCR